MDLKSGQLYALAAFVTRLLCTYMVKKYTKSVFWGINERSLKKPPGESMKLKNISLITALSACLMSPVLAQAGTYEEAVMDAKASINNAKALNNEWRDSSKLLEKADKLNKEGKSDKAMKLVAEAKKQGDMAVVQAKLQASVSGPHN
jgi:hypothetical protein